MFLSVQPSYPTVCRACDQGPLLKLDNVFKMIRIFFVPFQMLNLDFSLALNSLKKTKKEKFQELQLYHRLRNLSRNQFLFDNRRQKNKMKILHSALGTFLVPKAAIFNSSWKSKCCTFRNCQNLGPFDHKAKCSTAI